MGFIRLIFASVFTEIYVRKLRIYFKKTKNGNDRHIAMNDLLLETMQYLYQNKIKDSEGFKNIKNTNHLNAIPFIFLSLSSLNLLNSSHA